MPMPVKTSDSQSQSMNPITKLRKPEMYKPLVISMTFFGFQQLSGIFVVIVYASKISVEAGVTLDPFLCTVLIGIMRVIATIVVAFTLDSFGRKPITVGAGTLMSFCMLGLAAILQFPSFSTQYASWLPTFLLLAYIFTSTLSFLTVPFSMLPELFNQQNRGLAAGLASGFMHFSSFLLIKFYPDMLDVMGIELLFVFYGGMSLIGVVFVQLFVPETKNKTLVEIEKFFKKDETVGSSS